MTKSNLRGTPRKKPGRKKGYRPMIAKKSQAKKIALRNNKSADD